MNFILRKKNLKFNFNIFPITQAYIGYETRIGHQHGV